MKKLLLIFWTFAFFLGCEKIDSDVSVKDDESLITGIVLPETLYASVADGP